METKKLKYHLVKAFTTEDSDPRCLNNKRMLIEEMVSCRQGVHFCISTIYGHRNRGETKFFIGFFAAYTPHKDNEGRFLENIVHDVGLLLNTRQRTTKNPLHKRLGEIMKDHCNPVISDFILVCNRWTLTQQTNAMLDDASQTVQISYSQTERGVTAADIPADPVRYVVNSIRSKCFFFHTSFA